MELILTLLILSFYKSVHGQNIPEGVILTTPATTATGPATTEISTKTTHSLTSDIISTENPPNGDVTTASIIATLATRKKSKNTKKSKEFKRRNDTRSNDESDKKFGKELKEKPQKSKTRNIKSNKRKVKKRLKQNEKRKVKKRLKQDEKKEERKEKRQNNKAIRKKTKTLFKQARTRLKALRKRMKKAFRLSNRKYMKEFLRNCTELFKSARREKRMRRKGISVADAESTPPNGFEIVTMMNKFGQNIASMLRTERRKKRKRKEMLPISSDGIEMEVSVFVTDGFQGHKFPDPTSQLNVTDSIYLPADIFNNTTEENGTIISIVYDSFFEMSVAGNDNDSVGSFINSKVVSATVEPQPPTKLTNPVEVVLYHLQEPNNTKPECVFWKVNESNLESAHWSSDGCMVFKSNKSHTICHCNHLTDFAVLFRVTETKEKLTIENRRALTIISLVGCLLSAVCLLVTVIIFIFLKKLLKNTRNLLHLNLAVALLIANVLFLLSGNAASKRVLCLSLSVCLFYFFLSAFFWMLGEGIYIWIMLARIFSENLKAWMYLGIGWGIPFVIVAISFGVYRYNLVADNFCWLSIQNGAIWTFIGPVIFVIVVNLGILIKVLCTAVEHQSNEGRLKVSARLTLLLMPILGLTWLFGLLTMNTDTIVFDYLFAIFNSCQGIFIFLCYIAFNSEVRNEYQKWRTKREYVQSLPMKTTSSSSAAGDRRSRSGTQNETSQMVI